MLSGQRDAHPGIAGLRLCFLARRKRGRPARRLDAGRLRALGWSEDLRQRAGVGRAASQPPSGQATPSLRPGRVRSEVRSRDLANYRRAPQSRRARVVAAPGGSIKPNASNKSTSRPRARRRDAASPHWDAVAGAAAVRAGRRSVTPTVRDCRPSPGEAISRLYLGRRRLSIVPRASLLRQHLRGVLPVASGARGRGIP